MSDRILSLGDTVDRLGQLFIERCDREARARDMVKRREAAQLYYGNFAVAEAQEGDTDD